MSSLPTTTAAAKCSSKGVSAPPKGENPSDWGLPASAANLVHADWVEDVVVDDADDGSEE